MANVTLKNITKVYGKKIKAVADFNLEIQDKEFVVFVGPSGCGKTTTLRMIAGLEDITSGELLIGDKKVNDLAPKDRDIAMVFQNYALYPHMTVFENMAFSLKVKKMPKDDINKRVMEAAQILDITEYLDRLPKELSGGQRQRVAIGRAIVRKPSAFLMDEPLSNLDAKLRTAMRTELIKLHRRLQATIVYVTHDQVEAMTLGDRIVVMKDGVVQQADTPKAIYANPKNIFVAGFIGSPQMNFLEGELVKNGQSYAVKIEDKIFALSQEKSNILEKKNVGEAEVIVGVRPEHFDLCAESTDNLKMKIDVIESIGSEMYIHTMYGEMQVVLKVNSEQEMRGIKDVYCCPKLDRMHIFSKETEDNLLYMNNTIAV